MLIEYTNTFVQDVVRNLNFTKPVRDLKTRLMANSKDTTGENFKELLLFADLLENCLNLNPEKRYSPIEALKHPFITKVPQEQRSNK